MKAVLQIEKICDTALPVLVFDITRQVVPALETE